MKYLFSVLGIVLSWVVIISIMPLVNADQRMFIYYLAIINTFVLYMIGFRNS